LFARAPRLGAALGLSVVCEPQRAPLQRAHLRRVLAPSGGLRSSRCRYRHEDPAVLFTARASVPIDPAQHGGAQLLLPAAANPLRPSAERAEPDVVTSDALCRSAAPAGDLLHPALAEHAPACAGSGSCPARTSIPHRRIRAVGLVGPGRLPSDRCLTLLPGRATSRLLFRPAFVHPAPLSPEALQLHCHEERPIRATRRGLRHPCGHWRLRWKDASHRLLQPTYSTSTHKTV
jgi:hypothetical protein